MIEKPVFKEGNVAFAKALNQVADYAEQKGVNAEGVPDWSETLNGWRPPINASSDEDLTPHPYEVRIISQNTQTQEAVVQVSQGTILDGGLWVSPTWSGGDNWDTDKTIDTSSDGTTVLRMRVDVDADLAEITGSTIGWDLSVVQSKANVEVQFNPQTTTSLDTSGGPTTPASLTTTATDGEYRIDIATVTIADSLITSINQHVRTDIIFSPRVHYTFVNASTTSTGSSP